MQPQFWRNGLKKGRLMTLLSFLTLAPSTLKIGAESMGLSEASLAKTSLLPASALEFKKATAVDSGLSSQEPFARLDQDSCSWRTCQGSLLTQTWDEYSETFPRWGSMRNGACFQRLKSARAIDESECSSWRTPQNRDHRPSKLGNRTKNHDQIYLSHQVDDWPTLNVPNGGRKLDPKYVATKGQTPNGKAQVGLENAAEFWSTPNAHDGRRPGVDDKSTQGRNLNREAGQWPTPANRDYKGDNSTLHVTETGGGQETSGSAPELRYAHLPTFPPGPNREAWREIIERWPELAPAVADGDESGRSIERRDVLLNRERQAFGDEADGCGPTDDRQEEETQPELRWMADGISSQLGGHHRVDQLRSYGNAVVPLCAALAFVTLARKAGLI